MRTTRRVESASRSMIRDPNRPIHSRHSTAKCGRARIHRAVIAWRKQPHRIFEKCSLAIGCAAYFLARHGMSGQKARMAGLVVPAFCAGGDLALGAADIRDQLIRLQQGRELLHPSDNGEDWPAQHDQVRVLHRRGCVVRSCVNRGAVQRNL